ncbi:MAG: DUF2207 family protein [Brooklawnia sp.]
MQLVALILGIVALVAAIVVVLGTRPREPDEPVRVPGLIIPERTLTAPAQQTPGTVGPLLEGEVAERDLRLTLVDLAARGYLQITSLADEQSRNYDWVIRRTDKPLGTELHRFEEALLTRPFTAERKSLTLSGLTMLATRPLASAEAALREHLHHQGWFSAESAPKHSPWGWVGALVLLLGLLLTVYELIEWLATSDFRGVVGGALVMAAGVLLASRGRRHQSQTDAAEQARDQLREYRDAVAEPTAEDLPPAELRELFNRLLPWAVALGVQDEFAARVDAVAQRAAGWGRPVALQLDWLASPATQAEPTALACARTATELVGVAGRPGATDRKSRRARSRA